jgi:MFS family permease
MDGIRADYVNVASIGIVTICQGFVQNMGGLIACRILIGVFEAGFLPGESAASTQHD